MFSCQRIFKVVCDRTGKAVVSDATFYEAHKACIREGLIIICSRTNSVRKGMVAFYCGHEDRVKPVLQAPEEFKTILAIWR